MALPDVPADPDHLSRLPNEVLDAIARWFPFGAAEPSRLAMTGRALHAALEHRALTDKLFRMTVVADASALIEIIKAARTLPDRLRCSVLRCVAEQLTNLCPNSPCLAAPFDALRSAIASIEQAPYRIAASLALGEQFCDDRFMRLPVTPALEDFFQAFRDDIDGVQNLEARHAMISRWAGGLRMLRDPTERLQQWQALFTSEAGQPTRTDLVVSLSFALMALPPVAERIAAIDAVIGEAARLPGRAQAALLAPVLHAIGQEPADQAQREERFFLLWKRALLLPAAERQVALCQLVSRCRLLSTAIRFDSMRCFVAQINELGYAHGTDLLCATINAIPQLLGGAERELTWHACSMAMGPVPIDKLDAPLGALILTLRFLPTNAFRASRFAAVACMIVGLPPAQQALPINRLLQVVKTLPAGVVRFEAMTKLMLLIQMAPAADRVPNMRTMLETLDHTVPPVDLDTVFRWVKRTVPDLSPDQRHAVIVSMANALPAFRHRDILYIGVRVVQEQTYGLTAGQAAQVTGQVDRFLVSAADALHGEMMHLPSDQRVRRFDDLLAAACLGSGAPRLPVIEAVVSVVEFAFRSENDCRDELLRSCRAALPPSFHHLLERAVVTPT